MAGPSWTRLSTEEDDELLEGVAGSAAEEREYFKSLQERRSKLNRSRNSRENRRGNYVKIASLCILAILLIFNVYFHNHKDDAASSIVPFSKSSDNAADDTPDKGKLEGTDQEDDLIDDAQLWNKNKINDEDVEGINKEDDLTDDAQLWNVNNDDGLLFEKKESDGVGAKPKRIERISILGERNTKETELIVNLMNCFPDLEVSTSLNRLGHWFQDETVTIAPKPTLVVALFLNIYDWVDLMRTNPIGAPEHENLDWSAFVTKPWTMPRPSSDEKIEVKEKSAKNICQWEFSYDEVIPCFTTINSVDDAVYELRRDKSGKPFNSIVNLRAEKIRNYLSTREFKNVQHVIPVKYEKLLESGGLDGLVEMIMLATNLPSKCDVSGTKLKPLTESVAQYSDKYVEWIDNNTEWDAENQIGYKKGEMSDLSSVFIDKPDQNSNDKSKNEDGDEFWTGPSDSKYENKDEKTAELKNDDDDFYKEMDEKPTDGNKQYGGSIESKSDNDETWHNQGSSDSKQEDESLLFTDDRWFEDNEDKSPEVTDETNLRPNDNKSSEYDELKEMVEKKTDVDSTESKIKDESKQKFDDDEVNLWFDKTSPKKEDYGEQLTKENDPYSTGSKTKDESKQTFDDDEVNLWFDKTPKEDFGEQSTKEGDTVSTESQIKDEPEQQIDDDEVNLWFDKASPKEAHGEQTSKEGDTVSTESQIKDGSKQTFDDDEVNLWFDKASPKEAYGEQTSKEGDTVSTESKMKDESKQQIDDDEVNQWFDKTSSSKNEGYDEQPNKESEEDLWYDKIPSSENKDNDSAVFKSENNILGGEDSTFFNSEANPLGDESKEKSDPETDLWGDALKEPPKTSEASSNKGETESNSDTWSEEFKETLGLPKKTETLDKSDMLNTLELGKEKSTEGEDTSLVKSVASSTMEDDFISELVGDTIDSFSKTSETSIKPKVIALLAERNSGLEWLYPKIQQCFPDVEVTTALTRPSPWFQTPENAKQLDPALVIALFMNPFTWVDLMRANPVHAENHKNKEWFSFVSSAWTMDRPDEDTQITNCQYDFKYDEVLPCGSLNTGDRPVYEMKCKESRKCEAYKNILELRADKISNFLSVEKWENVLSLVTVMYESLTSSDGFSYLITQIEEESGLKATCKEIELKAPVPPSKLTDEDKEEFETWMKANVNWAPEYDIGYGKSIGKEIWG